MLFIIVLFSTTVFSEEKVEDLPREKTKSLGKWEVVPSLVTKEEKKKRKKTFTKRVRNMDKPVLNLEKEDEALVVYNKERRSSGTVNGTLIINLADNNDERDILKDFPLRKIRLEKKIRFGFYKIKSGNDIDQVVENLKKDPRIKSVEVEVISSRGSLKPQ